ncbi:MAG: SpoIIE family protein phosphatase [Verrucomicrobia bacterium]|nr:SpoIIE family protein phosphatase [Verrucomicrobiota bacterium]
MRRLRRQARRASPSSREDPGTAQSICESRMSDDPSTSRRSEPSALARARHDLRTPMNHVLGYAEMLLEENPPEEFRSDLSKILASGRRLLELINLYLDERTFESSRADLPRVFHDLRTPVNHIIGYSEILQERAEECGNAEWIPDLRRIREAAGTWLQLMESLLVPLSEQSVASVGMGASSPPASRAFHSGALPSRTTRRLAGVVLVVDDNAGNRDLLVRRLRREGHTAHEAADGNRALEVWRRERPDVVLLDVQMPDLDGYTLLQQAMGDAELREAAVIMVSGFDRQEGIARCIEAGAEDYLIKPFDAVLLRARVAACLEKKELRDQERRTHRALVESQARLTAELAEAAGYVRSLLPAPLSGAISTEWVFRPSAQLGGDAFGYHWIDDEHFALYLLDVCGHGIGAALLSVSALNLIRSEALPGVDPREPAAVMAGLNKAFPMEAQNQQYFTIWYGVFRSTDRELRFASAGHPPAFRIGAGGERAPSIHDLRTPAPPIGCLPEARFSQQSAPLGQGDTLLIFSDGAYEFQNADGAPITLAEYRQWLARQVTVSPLRLGDCVRFAETHSRGADLEDDMSILCVRF